MSARQGEAGTAVPAAGSLRVREGTVADAPAVAALHAAGIAEGFLSTLGPVVLRRLYRRICRSDHAFLIVAEAGGEVAGFVAGSTALGRLYRQFVARDGAVVAAGAALRLARRWRQVAETLRQGDRAEQDPAGAELLAIAVAPAWRRRGAGALLVGAFLDEAARRGADAVDVVVAEDNDAAGRLYRAAGFETHRRLEVHAGTTSLVLRGRAGTGRVPGGPA